MHSTHDDQDDKHTPTITLRRMVQRPVFVDNSGRRPWRARWVGRLLVVPAVGYVVLLVSTALGGPSVQAPFLPLPQAPKPPAVAPPAVAVSGGARPSPSHKPASGRHTFRARPSTGGSPHASTGPTPTASKRTPPGTGSTHHPVSTHSPAH
jgi:hypothetical protein